MNRTTNAVLLTLCSFLAWPLPAQTRFVEHAKEHFPRTPFPTQGIAFGDLDGDGDLDVVLANYAVQNRLFLNDGKGVFTDATSQLPVDTDYTLAVALVDVDGDGSLDIFFANYQQQTKILLNDGHAHFRDATAGRMPATFERVTSIAVGDVNGDKAPDFVLGADTGQTRLYLNNGSGFFTDATASRMPNTTADRTNGVALCDVDGDGQLDLVLANYQGQSRLFLNRSLGTFIDATARMPVGAWACTGIAVGDVNGDRAIDIVLGATGEQKRLLINDGRGNFSDQSSKLPFDQDPTLAVALADVDKDGDLDLIIANCGTPYGHQNRLYANDGRGNFSEATAARMPVDSDYTTCLAVGDVDGDGDLDLAMGNSGPWMQQSRLYLNDGTGTFLDGSAECIPQFKDITRAVAVGDVDGDGCLDIVFGNRGSESRVYLGNRKTAVVDATQTWLPAVTDNIQAIVLGDVDGDGRLDLITGSDSQQIRLFLNNGTKFVDSTAGHMPAAADMTSSLALGDVNGDGFLDLVVGNYSQPNRLFLNDGRGHFTDVTATHLNAALQLTASVVLVDVDHDGDLDLVVGNFGQSQLFLNDGTGHFTEVTAAKMPVNNDATTSLAAGDVNKDGFPDLVLGNLGQDRLYLNDGTGKFTDVTATHFPVDGSMTLSLALGDVDEDGDLDLVVGNDHQPTLLYLNDGTGHFTDVSATSMPLFPDPTAALALADIDRDGDLDIVVGNFGPCIFFCNPQQNRLLLNLRRQIHVPLVMRTNQPIRVDINVDRGTSPLPGVAIPLLSLTELVPQIHVGTLGFLGVDPITAVPGPVILCNGPGDTGVFTFTLPNELAGVTLLIQAVILPTANAADWRLGNITSDRVIR